MNKAQSMLVTPKPSFSPAHQPFIDAVHEFPAPEAAGSIFERFSEQADRLPDKTAVIGDAGPLSYAALRTLAGRVAHAINSGPDRWNDAPVALQFEDQAALVAAILGVLQSGRPYLVLDPSYPRELREFMLRDSTAQLLVVQGQARTGPTAASALSPGCRLLHYDDALRGGVQIDASRPADPGRAALLLYTSGSTGRPLGIMHSHANILAEIQDNTRLLKTGSRDVWLQYASPAFASAVRSTYGALLNGGTLVLHDIARNGFAGLEDTMNANGVTIYRSLPTTFRHFLMTLGPRRVFSSVRIVTLGGETITPSDVALFNRHFAPHCILATNYGPSECLGAFVGFIVHGAECDGPRVPLGYARPGKRVRLEDANGAPVVQGAAGEITVTGRYIADAYWRDPQASAHRFRSNKDGTRTFLTGDVGTSDRNGLVTHLGRKDFQVKIRGYRVDTGEVEQCIRDVPGVEDAVVVACPDHHSETRLVACVVSGRAGPGLAGTIQRSLQARLPAYKLPAAVEFHNAFPLSPNGKIDRRALADLERAQPRAAERIVPDTDARRTIARIWGDTLGIEQISLGVPLLDYGGNSLHAAQIAGKLADEFGVSVPVATLLAASGVEHIDKIIKELGENARNE